MIAVDNEWGAATGVTVAVAVGGRVGVLVGTGTGVTVAVAVGGRVAVLVGAATGVSVAVAVGGRVAVLVGTGTGVSFAAAVGVRVGVLLEAGLGVSVVAAVGVLLGCGACEPGAGLAGPACSSSCMRVDSAPTCSVRVVCCIKRTASTMSAATTAAIVRSRKTKRKNRFMGDFLYAVRRYG